MTGSSNRLTGGCQCGALRYEWLEKPTHSSVCYCRMCQKASGQPFMGLTGGERENLRWTRGMSSDPRKLCCRIIVHGNSGLSQNQNTLGLEKRKYFQSTKEANLA